MLNHDGQVHPAAAQIQMMYFMNLPHQCKASDWETNSLILGLNTL